MTEPLLDRASIRALLEELGSRLDGRGIEARMFVVGGSAMALAFSARRVTRDIDAVFEPKAEVYAEASTMARDRGLPEGWLNDAVKGLLPDRGSPVEGSASFSVVGLKVGIASAEYLFAMKAMAARQETDGDDLRELVRQLDLPDANAALALVERYYGQGRLSVKTQLIIEDLFGGRGPELP